MRKSFSIIAILNLVLTGLCADESTRKQDLNTIFQKTWFSPQRDSFLSMVAQQAAAENEKQLDTDTMLTKFHASLTNEAVWEKFYSTYSSFTDEEIHDLRKIHENPVYHKYSEQSGKIFQDVVAIFGDMFKTIIDRDGVEESAKEMITDVLEITQANFQKEICESKKPIVIDIYSTSCQPCRLMESTFKEMSLEYKEEIRFAKINCETEIELARKYNVTHLPTFLFIRPGEETPALEVKGFTSKKNFRAKIDEFLQNE